MDSHLPLSVAMALWHSGIEGLWIRCSARGDVASACKREGCGCISAHGAVSLKLEKACTYFLPFQ